ncbi:alpha/beta hydrolase [Streptomyces racemochromogenes]|uniref:alpha/beta hydrolase n=1 Tax=Streptomyces racemochromogenes TaxID=67353 RepID=UPI0031E5765B
MQQQYPQTSPYAQQPQPQPSYGHPPMGPGHGPGPGAGPEQLCVHCGQPPFGPPRPKRSRAKLWIGGAVVAALLAGGGGYAYWGTDWFDGNGEDVTFAKPKPPAQGAGEGSGGGAAATGPDPDVSLPAGPAAQFKQTTKLDDGTRISKTRLKGAKSGFEGDVWVWTPKEYDDPKYANSAFPVMIALPGGNGYPDNYWATMPNIGLQKAIAEASAKGTGLPFVLVMPLLNPDNKNYYDGSDIPGQPKMGTWIAEDVPDLAKANFRTYKSRDGWAIMGNSSGAFVGLKQVMQHPEKFRGVIANGGETAPDSPLWKNNKAEMDANDPAKLAQKLIQSKGPEVYVNFQYGTKEGGRERLEKFQRENGKGPIKIDLYEIKGGDHNGWDYVRGMKEQGLEALSKVMKGPKPNAG